MLARLTGLEPAQLTFALFFTASPRHGLVASRISASSFLKINAIALVAFGAPWSGAFLRYHSERFRSSLHAGAGGIANHELRHNHHVTGGQVWFCLAFEHCVKGGDG
jgi:hypothetical protein